MLKRSMLVYASALAALCLNPMLLPFATTLGVSSAIAANAYAPGESQQQLDLARGTWAIYPAGQGQVLAQTFTPLANGWLGYLQLPVGCAENVLLNVKIRAGLAGPVLYEVDVAGLPEAIDGTFQLLQVYDPAVSRHGLKLHKGREYAFELAAFPAPGATDSTCGIAKGPAVNAYPRGRGYYEDVPVNGAGFLPLPFGAPTDDEDLPFVTLVR
ncbi:MAG: hypothetical protein U1F58_08700 [Burkholderiales bacterium]